MSDSGLRVAFAGTPEFAAVALRAIIDAGFDVPLVLTQPDRRSGRGMKQVSSAVKQVALEHGIAIDQPEKLRTPSQREALRQCAPDVLVVAAYGLILPREVLKLPRYGCLNIHASLLPRWRGAAPIHRAIEAGDTATGVTIMQMDEGLDTGGMLLRRAVPILPEDTAASLHDRLAVLGSEMAVEVLDRLPAGTLEGVPQPIEGVTYAEKIGKREAMLDWRRPAEALVRAVRAFDPFPGAQAVVHGTTLKIWRAEAEADDAGAAPGAVLSAGNDGVRVACGEGVLRLSRLQRPGSRRLAAEAFLRGFPIEQGDRFVSVLADD